MHRCIPHIPPEAPWSTCAGLCTTFIALMSSPCFSADRRGLSAGMPKLGLGLRPRWMSTSDEGKDAPGAEAKTEKKKAKQFGAKVKKKAAE
eukprot:198895-Amorphochlora_amoeboformis.AAC.1